MTETQPSELAKALAAFQADLPSVGKHATGQVGQNRNYKYADLPDVTAAVLPALAKQGLAWTTLPTFSTDGRFVLRYELLHVSGESRVGEWPLPEQASPQQIGSAITYARRYALSAVTGVAADEDDDGAAANDTRAAQRRPQRPRAVQDQPAEDPAGAAKAELLALVEQSPYTPPQVAAEYAARMHTPLGDEQNAARIAEFTAAFRKDPQAVMGNPKAAA